MLTMKKADYEKILSHAKENLPEEACGLIADLAAECAEKTGSCSLRQYITERNR